MARKAGVKRPRKVSVAALRKMHPLAWVRRVVWIGPDDESERMHVEIEGSAALVGLMLLTTVLALEKDPRTRGYPLMMEPNAEPPARPSSSFRWTVRSERGPGLRSWEQLSVKEREDVLKEYPLARSLPGLLPAMTGWFYRRAP